MTYQKLCTEFYDLEPHKDGALALKFYLHAAQHAHGAILEPMCGTGRFLIPLLQAGYHIKGFDASKPMLDALKKKYAQLTTQPAPVWQQYVQDFTKTTSTGEQYSLIFIPYGSWGLITDLAAAHTGLQNLHEHLGPEGKIFIEIETIHSVPTDLNTWHRGVHTRKDGSFIALNTKPTYNATTQRFQATCHYESIIGNKITETETEDFQMHLYRFEEFNTMLRAVGFRQITTYQDYQRTPALPHAPLLIYECKK